MKLELPRDVEIEHAEGSAVQYVLNSDGTTDSDSHVGAPKNFFYRGDF